MRTLFEENEEVIKYPKSQFNYKIINYVILKKCKYH